MKMKQESQLVSSVQSLLGMPAQESNGKSCAHLRVVSAEAASLNEVRTTILCCSPTTPISLLVREQGDIPAKTSHAFRLEIFLPMS